MIYSHILLYLLLKFISYKLNKSANKWKSLFIHEIDIFKCDWNWDLFDELIVN